MTNLVSDWGIDVSSYDAKQNDGSYKAMDWATARTQGGIGTAIIKASEGTGWSDPAFPAQWAAAKVGGSVRVAYHFLRSNLSGTQQADYFLNILHNNGFNSNDFIMLDFETQDGTDRTLCLSRANAFMIEASKTIPVSHISLYTYPSFWNSLGGNINAPWAAQYKLVLAQWPKDYYIASLPINMFYSGTLATFKQQITTGQYLPMKLLPWKAPAIWQFTSRVSPSAIPGYVGIKKSVDYNAVYPSFLGGVTPPPPVSTTISYKTTVTVNVRSCAQDACPIVGVVAINAIVTGENPAVVSGTRTHVLTPYNGWIYSSYLTKI
jgi:GH25 family lysozyme M1 (1,4-beta-N-acetylmuramidase)